MTLKIAIPLTLLSCLLLWACDTKTRNVDACGDGFVDPGEQCDTTVGEHSCASLGYYNALGTLTCTSDCQFDDSACGGRCGDELVQGPDGETCDGGNLNGQTCQSLGYGGGTLACGADCAYDLDGCTNVCGNGLVEGDEGCDDDGVAPGDGCSATCTVEEGWECAGTSPSRCAPICGDGQLVGDEACDGANLDQKTCESLNYHAGTLVCASDCTLDTSDCEAAGRCGDGSIQGGFGEVCDGAELAGATCESLGYHGGTLACASDCLSFNLTSCEAQGRCGDALIQTNHGEVCDGTLFGGETCVTQGYYGGTLACSSNCLFLDLTSCAETGQCGDGLIQVAFGEVCDGAQLNGQTCEGRGYYGGTLACNANCQGFNEGQCLGRCGDGVVQTANGEQCEGSDVGGQTCAGLGFYEGTLACNPATCRFVTTNCTGSCGDFVIQAVHGEECDRSQLDGQTCVSQGHYPGTLACDPDSCQFDFTGCGGSCGDGIIQLEHGEDCEGSDLGGQTCESLGYTPRSGGPLACLPGCVFDESACVEKSANADLATLTVSAGTLNPVFSPTTMSYGVSLPYSVTSLTVTATAADAPWATVEISPAQPMTLAEGVNPVTVTVTAENGTQKVYTISVYRWGENYTSANIGEMLYVPSGTFQRDSTATNMSQVSAFRMSQYEITRAQWTAVTGWADPSDVADSSGTSDPVQKVNWYAAIAFCNKLSLLEGLTPVYTVSGVDFTTLTYAQIPTTSDATWNAATANWAANGYRLPTEMEWMWAAMGADSASPGMTNTTGYAKVFAGSTGSNVIGDYAWYSANSGSKTHPVGTKLANELGFHDLSGNVWEWAWDWYAASYPAGTVTDYRGPGSGTNRVGRGGGWGSAASGCTVASRNGSNPINRSNYFGFRVVRP